MTQSLLKSDPVDWQRRETRLTTILLIGRISTASRNDICRIRNLSAGGMRFETLAPIEIGDRVTVALKNGTDLQGKVVWTQGAEAGLQFDKPVEPGDMLANGARPRQSLRLNASCPVMLRRNGHLEAGVLHDISQGGARVMLSNDARADEPVTIVIPGVESRRAVVRWTGEGTLGLAFEDTLAFADLAQWLASDQRFSARRTPRLKAVSQNS